MDETLAECRWPPPCRHWTERTELCPNGEALTEGPYAVMMENKQLSDYKQAWRAKRLLEKERYVESIRAENEKKAAEARQR